MKQPKSKQRLFAAYMEAVDNQLRDNTPPESRIAYKRLQRAGYSELDAKKFIAQVIASETYWMLKKKEQYNQQRLIKNLNRLPDEPEEYL